MKIKDKKVLNFFLKIFKKGIDKSIQVWYNVITIKEGEIKMINIRTINKLGNNDGLTLKNGKLINYKTGYQVATEGVEVKTARECINAVKAYNGNCGVWLENGIYYVDKSHRENTKKKALEVGRACNQISILKWQDMSLIYC